jgi:hypothetical protein
MVLPPAPVRPAHPRRASALDGFFFGLEAGIVLEYGWAVGRQTRVVPLDRRNIGNRAEQANAMALSCDVSFSRTALRCGVTPS